jgi:mono/diheme cytochrome c family protein
MCATRRLLPCARAARKAFARPSRPDAAAVGFLIVFGVVVALAAISGVRSGRDARQPSGGGSNGAQTTEDDGAAAPTAADRGRSGEPPQQLFAHACGTCHTLRAAGVRGVVGPDLDRVGGLTAERVREQIRTGTLDSSMPANLLVGDDADRVAAYVAREAGRRR